MRASAAALNWSGSMAMPVSLKGSRAQSLDELGNFWTLWQQIAMHHYLHILASHAHTHTSAATAGLTFGLLRPLNHGPTLFTRIHVTILACLYTPQHNRQIKIPNISPEHMHLHYCPSKHASTICHTNLLSLLWNTRISTSRNHTNGCIVDKQLAHREEN